MGRGAGSVQVTALGRRVSLTVKQVLAALLEQAADVEWDEQLGPERVAVQVTGQSKGPLQNRHQRPSLTLKRLLQGSIKKKKKVKTIGPKQALANYGTRTLDKSVLLSVFVKKVLLEHNQPLFIYCLCLLSERS